jgi:PucR family transcriptional regulator, proline-responsive transcriptional activator
MHNGGSMALTVQSLYDSTSGLYRLRLLAGKKGMTHPVSWIFYNEDASIVDFIRGSEIVITTGMNIERHKEISASSQLLKLINKLHELDAAGLIVNTGHFINDIPKDVIDFADSFNFPLFSMPWEIHMIDIMQDYGNRIVEDKQKRITLSKFFFNAIFYPEKNEGSDSIQKEQFKQTAENSKNTYTVILIEMSDELFVKSDDEITRYIDYSFTKKLSLQPSSFCWFIHDRKIVFVVMTESNAAGIKNTASVNVALSIQKTAASDSFLKNKRIGVSNDCILLKELRVAYDHALLALRFPRNQATNQQSVIHNADLSSLQQKSMLTFYDSLGIYKLLYEIKDYRVLESFYNEVLGPLNILSPDKRSDYLKTLRLYIESNGSVQMTAEENSTHRNTVNYRIKKIGEILGCDLQDGRKRCMIETALSIKDLLDTQNY